MGINSARETITIDEVKEGKYGPFARVGPAYYNKGKFFKGSFDDMKAGNTYEVEVYTTGTGGKYIQKLIAMVAAPKAESATADPAPASPVVAPPSTSSHKARDYDAEARGKTRCALMEAALQSPALASYATSVEEYKKLLIDAANYAYAYVFPNEAM